MKNEFPEFRHELLKLLIKGLEANYRLSLRLESDLSGAHGIIHDRQSGCRMFQMRADAAAPTEELERQPRVVAGHVAIPALAQFLGGLRAASAQRGDILLLMARPVHPAVFVEPLLSPTGHHAIRISLVVGLPERLHEGLPEGFRVA
jgi:hypothetical protein